MELIDIAPADLETVQHILLENAPGLEVRAFGSRVSWTARETSDLDLALMTNQPMSIARMAKLKAAFTESDLPFRVEVVDWASTSESFRKIIEKKYVAISASLVGGPGSITANLKVVPSAWREVGIGEVADIIGGGTPSTKDNKNFDGTIPWLTPKDLSGTHDRYVRRGKRNLSQQGLDRSSACLLPVGSVLLSTRAPIGYVALAKNPIATNQGFRSLVVRDEVHPEYLYYWLKQNTEELERHASGSTFREISGSSLKKIRLFLPPFPEQRAIAHVLGTLDDKIELNRRMSETLEEMARALFKSWFVNFDPVHAKAALKNHSSSNSLTLKKGKAAQEGEWTVERAHAYLDGIDPNIAALFPDGFMDSGLGEIPEGWEVKALGDFGDVITGKTPSTRNPEFYGKDVPFLKIPDMHGRMYVTETGTMLSNKGARSQSTKALPNGSVSVSCIATPGLVILNHQWTHTNQQINSIVPREDYISKYLYWSCKGLSSNILIGGSGGSVFGNMNKSTFSSLVVLNAGNKAIRAFDEVVSPLHKAILANEKERNYLTALRDTLLPKLVSGELRVNIPDTHSLNSP